MSIMPLWDETSDETPVQVAKQRNIMIEFYQMLALSYIAYLQVKTRVAHKTQRVDAFSACG